MKTINTKVVIIGAGITGLTTAYYLKKSGIDAIVVEKSGKVGGVIQTMRENGFIYETGPNTGVLSQPETQELINELDTGCQLEIANEKAKKRWIWKKDKWEALPSGLGSGIRTPLFTTRDKFRLLGEPFRKRGTNPDETLANLVLRRMGKSFLDYAVDPFILGIYSGDPSYLITRHALPKLYNLEQNYGSFIGGAIKKGFQKKDQRAAMATGQVFSVKGGLSNLINSLVSSIGMDRILLNFLNVAVNPENLKSDQIGNDLHSDSDYYQETPPVSIRYSTTGLLNNEPVRIDSQYVIISTGSHEFPSLLPFVDKLQMQSLSNLEYAKVVQATIGFKKWDGIQLDAFGGLVPFKENRDILGILFLSSFLSDRAPESGALLSVFMGGFRKPEVYDWTDDFITAILEKELKSMTGISEFKPDLLKITRYSHAIPQYGLSTGDRLKAAEMTQRLYPGLIIGGNMKNGIGMSDRIKQGREMATMIITRW